MESEVWDIRVSIWGIRYAKWDIRGRNGAFIRPNRSFEGENGALAHSNKKGFEKSEAFMNQFII